MNVSISLLRHMTLWFGSLIYYLYVEISLPGLDGGSFVLVRKAIHSRLLLSTRLEKCTSGKNG